MKTLAVIGLSMAIFAQICEIVRLVKKERLRRHNQKVAYEAWKSKQSPEMLKILEES